MERRRSGDLRVSAMGTGIGETGTGEARIGGAGGDRTAGGDRSVDVGTVNR